MKTTVELTGGRLRWCGKCPRCKKAFTHECDSQYFDLACTCGVKLSSHWHWPAENIWMIKDLAAVQHTKTEEPHQCDGRCLRRY